MNKFISASKATFGNKSGGGGVGAASKAPKAAMGKADGGKSGPTMFGKSSGGGQGPKGKDHPLKAMKGIC